MSTAPTIDTLSADERRQLLRAHARQEAASTAKVLETKLKQWQNVLLGIAQSQCHSDMAHALVKVARDPPAQSPAPMQTDKADDDLLAMFGDAAQ